MTEHAGDPKVSVGFTSEKGLRQRNEDFVAAALAGGEGEAADTAVALADGIGGARGGHVASEMAVRGFLDGLRDAPHTLEVASAAAPILNALNGRIHSQSLQDPALAGMGCTFTALVLRGRSAHMLHVGDSRCYRLAGDRLTQLSSDHAREVSGRLMLYRALGVEAELRLDYVAHPLAARDRFMLCSDGVHGALSDEVMAAVLRARRSADDASRALVRAALDAGSRDNCTALVLDIESLPAGEAGAAASQGRPRPTPRKRFTGLWLGLAALLALGLVIALLHR